jgi:zinc protease
MSIRNSKQIFTKNFRLSLVYCIIAICCLFASHASAGRIAEREVLKNGVTLLHSEKKTLPIIKVIVAIKAGSIVEPSAKAGLANLTADLLNEGTARRSAKEISDAIEFVGGSLNTSGGADYVTVSLSVLKKDMDLGFDLLSDVILNPSFSDEEIKRRKAVIKSSIIQQKEDPGTVASKAFSKAVFGEHPYGWPTEGTEDSLETITRQDILDFHRTYYLPNNAIMAVVGDINNSELKAIIEKYFSRWKQNEITAPRLPVPSPGQGRKVIKINKDITQANIMLGHLGITRDNPDFYAVIVMNYIFGGGGFASRLMDNIRDNKGLSYDVHSSFSANKYSGSFMAGLQTKNVSANAAIEEIIREMNRIMTEPVSDKELDDAKSYLTGSFPLRIDTNNKIAALLISIEYNNLGLDYADNYKTFIEAVTKDDVLRVARKYLNTKDYVLVIVGDIAKAALPY